MKALKLLFKRGTKIFSIQDLHEKLNLFYNKIVIVGFTNLAGCWLIRNSKVCFR